MGKNYLNEKRSSKINVNMNDVIEKFTEIYKKYPLVVNIIVLIAISVIKHYESTTKQSEQSSQE